MAEQSKQSTEAAATEKMYDTTELRKCKHCGKMFRHLVANVNGPKICWVCTCELGKEKT